MKLRRFEYQITAIYLIIGILWILFSDSILNNLVSNETTLTFFQSIKGIFYVVTTALLLFILVRNYTKQEKLSEEELKISNAKYKSLYEQAPLAYQSLNNEGIFIDINPQWCNTLGYQREEVIGQWFGNFLHPDYVEHFKSSFPKFKERGYINDVQFQMKKKDGSFIYVSYEGCIGYNPDGSVKQTYCTFKDITTEYLAKERLIEDKKRFKALFYDHTSNMLILDSKGNILNVNHAALKFYGYPLEKMKEMNISAINTLPKEEIDRQIDNIINNKKNYFTFKHRLATGEIRDVEVYSCQIKIQGDIHIYSIINDITQQLKNEKELIAAKEKAERSDRLKSAFLTNMSHEIRTPLNGVLGFANLLSEEEFPTEMVQQYAEIISSSGQRLLDLINKLLDISRIESGNMPVNITGFSPANIIDEIIDLYQFKAKENELTIKREIDENLENFKINSDPLLTNQIITNLIGNAIKFCRNGTIRIGFNVKDEHVEFYVIDNGPGISKEEQEHLFKRFYQVNQTLPSKEGTGLGLALSKLLTELLNGQIWFNSVFR